MGGLGFIHLGFLAAGAAVAVPIVIHLLFRQRARRVEIGTLHFLRVGAPGSSAAHARSGAGSLLALRGRRRVVARPLIRTTLLEGPRDTGE